MSELLNEREFSVVDGRQGGRFWADDAVFDIWIDKIGPMGALLYLFYCRVANSTGHSYWGRAKVAKKLGVSLPTVTKYNRILEKNGLIKIKDESGKSLSVTINNQKRDQETILPSQARPGNDVAQVDNVVARPGNDVATKEDTPKEDIFKEAEKLTSSDDKTVRTVLKGFGGHKVWSSPDGLSDEEYTRNRMAMEKLKMSLKESKKVPRKIYDSHEK